MTKEFSIQPLLKYVSPAHSWCVTYAKDGKQAQEWFDTEKQAEAFLIKVKQ